MKLRHIVAGTAIAGIALVMAGCGSDSDSGSDSDAGSSSTTATEAVCADKAALENSVNALSNVDVTGGKSAVTSAVNKVKSNLDALGDSVQADLRPEVDDVNDALNDLETAVGNFGDSSLTDSLQDIGNTIAKVGSTSGKLFSSLNTECP